MIDVYKKKILRYTEIIVSYFGDNQYELYNLCCDNFNWEGCKKVVEAQESLLKFFMTLDSSISLGSGMFMLVFSLCGVGICLNSLERNNNRCCVLFTCAG